MNKAELYASNVELLARDNPVEAYRLEQSTYPHLKPCITLDDESNFLDESREPPVYLHDQGGAVFAAQQWAKQLFLEECNVLFIYGLGLGYYYLPLKQWLKDPFHYLVFLEDNKGVVYHFLQTELAAEILKNSQIIIKILPSIEPNEEGWAKLRIAAASLLWAFAYAVPRISALQSYFFYRNDFFQAFSSQWQTMLFRAGERLREFHYAYSSTIFRNFYFNIPYLTEAIPGYLLGKTMDSIPAVLCGAGPSLAKQFSHLQTLSDKAFLIGSGSAMNALTQASIIPHVGGAIDHTPTQASRQLTSFAFDVPAFYQNRFYWQALDQWHGPLLYITGTGSYLVSEWFEKELGIQAEQIIMGVSTSNFLLEIARFLGCNPIIFVGMDLAYTNDKHYAEGVLTHPSDDPKEHEALSKKEQGLLAVPSVSGGEVFTNSQWIYEAVYTGAFQHRNPEITCINATEGGMAIPLVPNEPLSKVIEEHLTQSWDIEGWFHGAMQNAALHKIPSEKVFEAISKWKKSLEACIGHLAVLSTKPDPLHQEELYQEPVYTYLLETLITVFNTLNSLRIRKLKWQADRMEQEVIETDRWKFLQNYTEDHLKSLEEGLKAFEERSAILSQKIPQTGRLQEHIMPPETTPPTDSERKIISYPDGKIKIEAFYLAGKLHGPWTFYSPEGKILYRSVFVDGKRQGKVYAYYAEGTLYRLGNYVDGLFEGEQFHYYPDGTLKTFECYKKGLLNGKVQLYYSNGQMKKEQHFVDGKLQGLERLWDESGKLKLETTW